MHEFKTLVKRPTLRDRYSWRPKSALNYRARSAPGKSINPGKYNDPRPMRGTRRYKNPPLTSPVGRQGLWFCSLHAQCRITVLYKSAGPRPFCRTWTGDRERPTIPWNLREYKFRSAITYVVGYDALRSAGRMAEGGREGGREGHEGRKMRLPLECLIKPPRPPRSFG